MKSLIYCLLFFIFFLPTESFSQLKLIPGEQFLPGTAIKKVFASVEDHAVWALTTTGKVYLKQGFDTDFKLYEPTKDIVVEEITGYQQNDMYFLVKPNLIVHFKSGLKVEIKLPLPEITRVNNISIINETRVTPYYTNNPSVANRDYLAIATNKHLYKLFRGETNLFHKYEDFNEPVVDQPDWQITNTSHFSVDFQYTYPAYACNFQPDRNTLTFYTNFNSFFGAAIPDNGNYPSKINTTLSSSYFIDPNVNNTDYRLNLNFWGTDEGLYLKTLRDCPTISIVKAVDGVIVNDLEEIHALSPVAMQNYVLAATNKGIYYTPQSIFKAAKVEDIQFKPLAGFVAQTVNSLCMDTKEFDSADMGTGITYDTMCERVIWVGTDDGVRKIYSELEQEYFDNILIADQIYSKPQSNIGDFTKAVFDLCGSGNVNVRMRIREEFGSQLLIQWYKDGIEIPDLIGKREATLTMGGTYHFTATVLCENIKLNSIPIIINKDAGPEITFAHPATVRICGEMTYQFETKKMSGYTYRWFKDDVQINGSNQNKYTASESGKYRVEVSSCTGSFESSATTNLDVLPVVTPLLVKDKINYCIGETALLKVDNSQRQTTKWYLNDSELIDQQGKDQIYVNASGSYRVSFTNAAVCETNSEILAVDFLAMPRIILTRSSNTVLCPGETVRLTATSDVPSTFLWSSGETTSSINVRVAGKYMVTVFNAANCSVSSGEVEVVYYNLPDATITRSSQKSLCDGETVTLSVPFVQGNTYAWSNGATGNSITVNKSGDYKVIVNSNTGCSNESSISKVSQAGLPMLPQPAIQNICVEGGEELRLEAPVGFKFYTWNGKKTSSASFLVNAPGNYSLEIEDENSCKASTIYTVIPNCLTVSGPNAFSPNGDGVNDVWNIYGLKNDPKASISIFNRWGNKVHHTLGNKAFWDGNTSSELAAPGVYYYIITTKNSSSPVKGSLTLIR